ncbi:MAG: hypothetical protein NZ820_14160 [Dehalococcoidia bacterium]|nr:hypothetical protein [Dehalococcoidia bacterium]
MDIKKYLIVVIVSVLVLIGLTMLFEGYEPDNSIDVPTIPLIII